MKSASNIVLRLLGLLLLVAACLKGWQLLNEPVANKDIWTNRAFLIFTVEFEIALGIWLLSGIFKKVVWLAVLVCFSIFSIITLYKGFSGAASCGCFGSVKINPWITLFAVDIPAVIALTVFHPKHFTFYHLLKPFKLLKPAPSLLRLSTIVLISFILLSITTITLAFNEPAKETQEYIVLEPETWVGKELPILEYIEIGEQLKSGDWLVLFFHHDCPDCVEAIPVYEQMAKDLAGNEEFLKMAFIEVPPYGQSTVAEDSLCTFGQLGKTRKWFIKTPATALLTDGKVVSSWEGMPDLDTLFENLALCYD